MSAIAERKWSTLLFNPFVYIAGGQALGIGLAAIFVAGLAGLLGGMQFDGVLDMHGGAMNFRASATPGAALFILAEGFIDWLCLALVLVLCGKLVSRSAFRVLDVLGTQALARWPSVLMVALTLPPAFGNYSRALIEQIKRNPLQLPPLTPDAIYFFTAALLTLPLLVWMIALMYRAYAVSCNVRGAKAVATFILALVLAEVLSKVAIYAWHP
ncbi:MAG TPA: hypothetical protein VHY09_15580 [Candidatus Methylacidiphilales bacterium]|jgi:hypothetical protein|nr:hypothetical protein [Candidatus Methylacidiphilales bacterium]